jgi:hypothetical protein
MGHTAECSGDGCDTSTGWHRVRKAVVARTAAQGA